LSLSVNLFGFYDPPSKGDFFPCQFEVLLHGDDCVELENAFVIVFLNPQSNERVRITLDFIAREFPIHEGEVGSPATAQQRQFVNNRSSAVLFSEGLFQGIADVPI
jgi:hypothetical protein